MAAAAAGAEDEEGAMGDVVYAPAPTAAKWREAGMDGGRICPIRSNRD